MKDVFFIYISVCIPLAYIQWIACKFFLNNLRFAEEHKVITGCFAFILLFMWAANLIFFVVVAFWVIGLLFEYTHEHDLLLEELYKLK